jgi:hypothetical protein
MQFQQASSRRLQPLRNSFCQISQSHAPFCLVPTVYSVRCELSLCASVLLLTRRWLSPTDKILALYQTSWKGLKITGQALGGAMWEKEKEYFMMSEAIIGGDHWMGEWKRMLLYAVLSHSPTCIPGFGWGIVKTTALWDGLSLGACARWNH